jgi:hypothetical protein
MAMMKRAPAALSSGDQRIKCRQVTQIGSVGLLLVALAPGGTWGASPQQSQPLIPRVVLKLIIEDPALAGYLHPELAGRVPLVISDHLLAPGVTPSKFGQPVRILSDREVSSQPHLRFESFKVKGSRAKAVIEYKVEGVVAMFVLESTSPGWWKVLGVAKRQ